VQETVARLQGENSRLRKEKLDVVQENTTIKQEAHRDMVRAEARLKQEVKGLTAKTEGLKAELAKVTAARVEACEERDDLAQHRKHLEARVLEVRPPSQRHPMRGFLGASGNL
jgi:chromosome segregation ATPase